ncbi:MAG: hypothetical protein ACSHW0_05160 [Thalassotalea sp.]
MLGISFNVAANVPITVKVAFHKDVNFYPQNILKKQKKAVEFTAADMKYLSRNVISLIIFVQALDRAGLTVNFEFIPSSNPERSLALVQSGAALLSIKTLSEDHTPVNTLKSSPLLDSAHSLSGIYGLKSNHALMKVKSVQELKKFSAVIHHAWPSELKFLEELELPKLELSNSRASLFKQIAFRKIDFTILNISNDQSTDFIRRYQNITLVPVPGLLVIKSDKYQFVIAKHHPDSQRVFQALEKGLGIMREQGLIKQYFQQLIPLRSDLPNWKILNQAEVDKKVSSKNLVVPTGDKDLKK